MPAGARKGQKAARLVRKLGPAWGWSDAEIESLCSVLYTAPTPKARANRGRGRGRGNRGVKRRADDSVILTIGSSDEEVATPVPVPSVPDVKQKKT